ncbi:hypothetical protein EJB05_09149, partial [Eragrostis curvula]
MDARGTFAWGHKPVPPASNVLGSSSLLPLNNDGGSDSLTNINACPACGGSSGTRPRWTDSRYGSLQFSHFQTSFSEALKVPIRSIDKQGPTSHGKGFTLSADDFQELRVK